MPTIIIELHRWEGISLARKDLFYFALKLGCISLLIGRERISATLADVHEQVARLRAKGVL